MNTTKTPVKTAARIFVLVLASLAAFSAGEGTGPSSSNAWDDYIDVEARVQSHINALKDDKSIIMRAGAAKALGDMGTDAAAGIPALTEALANDKNTIVRSNAAKALGKIGRNNNECVHALSEALWNDKSAEVCKNVIWALGNIGDRSDTTVKALAAALNDRDPEVGSGAARALGRVGAGSRLAKYYLAKILLDSESALVRKNVAWAFGEMGPDAWKAVPVLARALEDKDDDVRLYAARALGRIGREALDAASALVRATKDRDARVRKEARTALKKIARDR